jgi:hypothetical protein
MLSGPILIRALQGIGYSIYWFTNKDTEGKSLEQITKRTSKIIGLEIPLFYFKS